LFGFLNLLTAVAGVMFVVIFLYAVFSTAIGNETSKVDVWFALARRGRQFHQTQMDVYLFLVV